MKTAAIFVFFASFAFGQDSAKPAPAITIEQQAEWLQARAELAEAQLAVKTAEARLNAAVKDIQAVCPAVGVNKAGRPECPPTPAEPAKIIKP